MHVAPHRRKCSAASSQFEQDTLLRPARTRIRKQHGPELSGIDSIDIEDTLESDLRLGGDDEGLHRAVHRGLTAWSDNEKIDIFGEPFDQTEHLRQSGAALEYDSDPVRCSPFSAGGRRREVSQGGRECRLHRRPMLAKLRVTFRDHIGGDHRRANRTRLNQRSDRAAHGVPVRFHKHRPLSKHLDHSYLERAHSELATTRRSRAEPHPWDRRRDTTWDRDTRPTGDLGGQPQPVSRCDPRRAGARSGDLQSDRLGIWSCDPQQRLGAPPIQTSAKPTDLTPASQPGQFDLNRRQRPWQRGGMYKSLRRHLRQCGPHAGSYRGPHVDKV